MQQNELLMKSLSSNRESDSNIISEKILLSESVNFLEIAATLKAQIKIKNFLNSTDKRLQLNMGHRNLKNREYSNLL